MDVIESGAKPTVIPPPHPFSYSQLCITIINQVAAVNGPALGGGLELAMSCNARVGTKNSVYGLPELKLGIIPGMGGTQRLPRLIGVATAVKVTLSGKPLPAKMAAKLGLLDQLVKKPKDLIPTAMKLVLAMASGAKPRRSALDSKGNLESPARANEAIDIARVKSRRKAKGTPHAAAYLQAVQVGVRKGGRAGIQEEVDQMTPLLREAPSAKALIHMFLATRLSPKVPGLQGVRPGRIKTVAVLGGGTMGAGIVALLLFKGYSVILKEINEKVLYAGVQRVVKTINSVIKRMKLPSMALEMGMRNLTPTTSYEDFNKCDLVIEAIIENIPIKQKVFADLEKSCRSDCILATNTSTLDIDVVGAKTKAQDRIIGLHFFSPAHVMPLLEIIRTNNTSKTTLATSIDFAKRIGKTAVTVGNCVGFTANRIFFPYGQAAAFLVDHGTDPYRIDDVLKKMVNMPMGVHEIGDLSGLDILAHVTKSYKTAYGERCYISSLGKYLLEAKRLGQKSGAGYYRYKGKETIPDPKGIAPFLAKARQGIQQFKVSDQEIMEMVMYPVVNESCRVLAEGFVIRASDIDVVSVTGYGFPAHKGGIMFWAESQGFKHIRDRLRYYADKYPHARGFFKPSQKLEELVAK